MRSGRVDEELEEAAVEVNGVAACCGSQVKSRKNHFAWKQAAGRAEAGRVCSRSDKRWRVAGHRESAIIAGAANRQRITRRIETSKAPNACTKTRIARRVNTNNLPGIHRLRFARKIFQEELLTRHELHKLPC
jgi:hypothetical protein